jgi:phage terminase small subunit
MGKKPGKRTTARKVEAEDAKPFTLPNVPVKPETDDDPWGDDGLTVRQRAFVEAYMGPASGNGKRAAEMAGYRSENIEALRVTASRLLTYANVQRAIERKIGEKFGSADDVRRSVAAIATGNAADYLEPDERGQWVISIKKLAEAGMLGLLHEIREEGFEHGGTVTIIKRKLKLYDKLKALELLARMNGQLIDRQRHEGQVNVTHSTEVKKILNDPTATELGNALQRRLATHAGGDGASSN